MQTCLLGGLIINETIPVAAAGLVVVFGAYLAFQNRRRLFDSRPPSITARYKPDPHNDKALIIYGWTGVEINKILDDFAVTYKLQGFKYLIRPEDHRLRVVFPEDIEPEKFSFLINYVQYPKGFDLKGRSILSAGMATLSPGFGLPSPALSGRKALFYVPTNDREFDLVFVRVGDQTYENSFAGKCWRPVNDPRLPSTAAELLR